MMGFTGGRRPLAAGAPPPPSRGNFLPPQQAQRLPIQQQGLGLGDATPPQPHCTTATTSSSSSTCAAPEFFQLPSSADNINLSAPAGYSSSLSSRSCYRGAGLFCYFCGLPHTGEIPSTLHGNPVAIDPNLNSVVTCCPNGRCRKPLPKCAICGLPFKTVVGVNRKDKDAMINPLPFDDFICFCQSCQHGGHAACYESWIELWKQRRKMQQDEAAARGEVLKEEDLEPLRCPVPDCPCTECFSGFFDVDGDTSCVDEGARITATGDGGAAAAALMGGMLDYSSSNDTPSTATSPAPSGEGGNRVVRGLDFSATAAGSPGAPGSPEFMMSPESGGRELDEVGSTTHLLLSRGGDRDGEGRTGMDEELMNDSSPGATSNPEFDFDIEEL